MKDPRKTAAEPSDPGIMDIVPTQEGYERWAELYDGEDNPLVLLEGQHIGALAGQVAGLDVADIGCGTGRHALRLSEAGARVTALDFSAAMLARARAKPAAASITFLRHDLAKPLPLQSGSFDRYFAAWCWITLRICGACLQNCAASAVLRGGSLSR